MDVLYKVLSGMHSESARTREIPRRCFTGIGLLLLATLLIWQFDLDLRFSRLFFLNQEWSGNQDPVVAFLYHTAHFPGIILGFCGLFMLLSGLIRRNEMRIRMGGFVVLVLLIAPGLLVNAIVKPLVSRPRPNQLEEFGGNAQFVYPWEETNGVHGHSFPSGHASIGFFLMVPGFLIRRRNSETARIWLGLGLFSGFFVGLLRISQGSHFLSDVVWSGGVVYLTCLLMAAWLKLSETEPVTKIQTKPVELKPQPIQLTSPLPVGTFCVARNSIATQESA